MPKDNRCDAMADEIIATYQLSHAALLQQARKRGMPLDVYLRSVLQDMVWRHILAIIEDGQEYTFLGVLRDAPTVYDPMGSLGTYAKMYDNFLRLVFWSLVASIRNRLGIHSITTNLQLIPAPSDAELETMLQQDDGD